MNPGFNMGWKTVEQEQTLILGGLPALLSMDISACIVVWELIMDRSKLIAMITGAIAIALSLAYLLLVQLLDFRGEMIPAPQSLAPSSAIAAQVLNRTL
jgi:hypothetical protein